MVGLAGPPAACEALAELSSCVLRSCHWQLLHTLAGRSLQPLPALYCSFGAVSELLPCCPAVLLTPTYFFPGLLRSCPAGRDRCSDCGEISVLRVPTEHRTCRGDVFLCPHGLRVVCRDCVETPALTASVADAATARQCDYCPSGQPERYHGYVEPRTVMPGLFRFLPEELFTLGSLARPRGGAKLFSTFQETAEAASSVNGAWGKKDRCPACRGKIRPSKAQVAHISPALRRDDVPRNRFTQLRENLLPTCKDCNDSCQSLNLFDYLLAFIQPQHTVDDSPVREVAFRLYDLHVPPTQRYKYCGSGPEFQVFEWVMGFHSPTWPQLPLAAIMRLPSPELAYLQAGRSYLQFV